MMNLLRLSATFVAGAFLLACGGGNDCETPNPDYDPLNPASEFCLDTPESLMPGSTLADREDEESESSGSRPGRTTRTKRVPAAYRAREAVALFPGKSGGNSRGRGWEENPAKKGEEKKNPRRKPEPKSGEEEPAEEGGGEEGSTEEAGEGEEPIEEGGGEEGPTEEGGGEEGASEEGGSEEGGEGGPAEESGGESSGVTCPDPTLQGEFQFQLADTSGILGGLNTLNTLYLDYVGLPECFVGEVQLDSQLAGGTGTITSVTVDGATLTMTGALEFPAGALPLLEWRYGHLLDCDGHLATPGFLCGDMNVSLDTGSPFPIPPFKFAAAQAETGYTIDTNSTGCDAIQQGGGGGQNDSCLGQCGGQAPSGCYCDAQCVGQGDCCEDACSVCGVCGEGDEAGESGGGTGETSGGGTGPCAGNCGQAGSSGNCYCDSSCVTYDDCCEDACSECGYDC